MAKRTIIPRLGPISALFEERLDRDRTDPSADDEASGSGRPGHPPRRDDAPKIPAGTKDRED